MLKNAFKVTAVSLFSSLLLASGVSAAVRCETQYGGKEVCVKTGQLQINKEVFDPQNKKFVDNLGLNDHRFAPGEEITFKLQIKNTGDNTLSKVTVSDILPSLVELSSGELSFELKDLTVGKTEEREFKAKVVAADKFPNDKNLVCVVNLAEAKSDSEKDRDTAQVCLEKKAGVPAKALPPTGPENSLMMLSAALIFLISGLYFVSKSRVLS